MIGKQWLLKTRFTANFVEFTSRWNKERFLAADDVIKTITKAKVAMEPNDAAIGMMRLKDTTGESSEVNIAWL